MAELRRIEHRTGRASRATLTGGPLAAWGLAWCAGYASAGVLQPPARWIVPLLVWAAAALFSWLPRRVQLRSGHEPAVRRAWSAVFLSSPLVVAVADPPSLDAAAILVGSLWAVAMLAYATATLDRAVAAASGFALVWGIVSVQQVVVSPMLGYAITGLPLAVVGMWRERGVPRG